MLGQTEQAFDGATLQECRRIGFLPLVEFAHPSLGQVRMLMENRDVSVYEVTIAAGFKEPGFHKHVVPYVFYVLNAGRANVRREKQGAAASRSSFRS